MPQKIALSRQTKLPAASQQEGLDIFWIENNAIHCAWRVVSPAFNSNGFQRYEIPNTGTIGNGLDPEANISAVTRYGTDWHVFWVAKDNNVYTAVWENNSWRTIPRPINNGGLADPKANIVAIERESNQNGQLRRMIEVFWVGLDGAIWNTYKIANENFPADRARAITPTHINANTKVAEATASLVAISRHRDSVDVLWLTPQGVRATWWWSGLRSQGVWNHNDCYMFEQDTIENVQAPLTVLAPSDTSLEIIWLNSNRGFIQWASHWLVNGHDWRSYREEVTTPYPIAPNRNFFSFVSSQNNNNKTHYLWVGEDGFIWSGVRTLSSQSWEFNKLSAFKVAEPLSHIIGVYLKNNIEVFLSSHLPQAWDAASHWLQLGAPSIKGQLPQNKVTLDREIGRGAFGVVYKATWNDSPNTAIAVKKLLNLRNPQQSFDHEIQILTALGASPYIIQLYGTCVGIDFAFAMEYMEGGSLNSFLYNIPAIDIPWPLRIQIALDIARGLAFLHSHNPSVIHRDLKSDNILLTRDRRAKIADVGIAKIAEITQTAIGTLAWMAPEVKSQQSYTKEVDTYSYGIVVIELGLRSLRTLARFQYNQEENRRTTFFNSTGWRNYSPSVKNTIIRCWATNPATRPPIHEVISRLNEIEQNEGNMVIPPQAPPKLQFRR